MDAYEVSLRDTRYGTVTINAENEEEARDRAIEAIGDNAVDWGAGIPDTEVEGVLKL